MVRTRTVGSLVLAATAMVVTPLSLPASAEAHGHHGGVYVGVGIGGFYGWGPYWGWGGALLGWGPGPYLRGAGRRLALGYAMMSGMGALDLNVKPKQAEVWVDGKYVADARDLDGDPSYLWLKQGSHHVVLYKAGFRSFEEDVDVNVGMIRRAQGEAREGRVAAAGARRFRHPTEPPRPESPEPRPRPPNPGASRAAASICASSRGTRPCTSTASTAGTARELPGLRLPAGHHRVELVRPGFRPLEKDFDVEAGRTIDLDLSMERGGGWKY